MRVAHGCAFSTFSTFRIAGSANRSCRPAHHPTCNLLDLAPLLGLTPHLQTLISAGQHSCVGASMLTWPGEMLLMHTHL